MSLPKVEIYTDGACSGNPSPGGWAAVLKVKVITNGKPRTVTKELSGGKAETTNNEMEFEAVLQGLLALNQACYITIYTDSQLVIGYLCQGWKGNKAHLLRIKANITALCNEMGHQVEFQKVKGHAGVTYNELADALAKAAIP